MGQYVAREAAAEAGDDGTMRSPEIRTYRTEIEVRAAGDGSVGTLVGYAAKFNKLSRNLGGFVEQIAPTAFNKALADGVRVMARYNHSDAGLLGTTDAGTLRLAVDEVGLRYEVDLPDTSVGRDLRVLAARGDVRFSSFAFHAHADGDEWSYTAQDYPLRTLTSVQPVDVAPVNDPAYLDTSSGLRSLAEARGLDFEVVSRHAASNDLRALLKPADQIETPSDERDEVRSLSLDDLRAALSSRAS